MNERDKLLAEFEYWLDREGIALPPERRLDALADFADVRKHVEVVEGVSQSNAEPSTVFLLRPDLHIVWSGDGPIPDPASLARRSLGHPLR